MTLGAGSGSFNCLYAAAGACGGNPTGAVVSGRIRRIKDNDRETYFSAEQSSPEEEARLPVSDEDPAGASSSLAASPQGAQAPLGLSSTGRHDAPARKESFRRDDKLRRRADYQRCYRQGRRRHGSLTILIATPNALELPRLGITVSKKVGNAVVRVRTKRRIREIYRRWRGRSRLPGLDLVVHVKPAAAQAGFEALRDELLAHLSRVRSDAPTS